MSPDRICGILAQTLTALLVVKEQIGSPQAIHLHMFQLPKEWVTLQYVHYHPHIPGERRRMGPTRAVSHHHTSSIMVYSSAGVSSIPSPTSTSASDSPAWKITGHHPATCIPLVHPGNTSLQCRRACQSPSQVHNSYTSNL